MTTLLEKYNTMLAALEAVRDSISQADVLFDPDPNWPGECERYDKAIKALAQVEAALQLTKA